MAKKGLLEQFINSPLAAKAGVPQGYPLRRYKQGEDLLHGPVVVGAVSYTHLTLPTNREG